ncbi:MAG: nuclease A inhibitor family protein [Arcicella sp.]|nr:nuclease A inhibitor family protein [Arcicella sp.]
MTTKIPDGSLKNITFSLKEQIENLIADLMYPSETDEKIEYFEMELSTAQKLSMSDFRMYNGVKPEVTIAEMHFEDFFKPLIKVEDWFGEEENRWAGDSLKLKNLLAENVKDFQIFKIGSAEMNVFVFGKAEECKWVGLKTKVVET